MLLGTEEGHLTPPMGGKVRAGFLKEMTHGTSHKERDKS